MIGNLKVHSDPVSLINVHSNQIPDQQEKGAQNLTSSLVREIAETVVREQLLENWKFYVLLLAITLLSTVASALLSSYIRKRAETYASKADLSELVRQLETTTQAAEAVKTAISHADWSVREWQSLRRTKLEELLTTVYDVRHWLDVDMNVRFFNEARTESKSPIWKLEVVSRLYFPELRVETQQLSLVYTQYMQWMLDVQKNLFKTANDMAARRIVHEEARDGLNTHHVALLKAISQIEEKAPQLLKTIAGV
ncbi:hypothetical protein NG825_00245 [Xanthomonas sacchari]|nr:hypothetical protein NG825_00245 [Xanthomonas sacchari]